MYIYNVNGVRNANSTFQNNILVENNLLGLIWDLDIVEINMGFCMITFFGGHTQ